MATIIWPKHRRDKTLSKNPITRSLIVYNKTIMKLSKQQTGNLFILSSGVLWGIFPVITILSYNSLSPLISLVLSSFFAGIFFAGMVTINKRWHEVLHKAALKNILLVTFFIGILYYLFTFMGLQFTSAGNASIVAMTEVFFSFLFFHVLRREHLPKTQIIGAGLMIVGAMIILAPNFTHFQLGDLLILLGGAIAPFGNFYAQKARKQVSSETIMMIRSFLSAIAILLIALAIKTPLSLPSIQQSLGFLLINGLLLLGLSKVFWMEGIHRIPVTTANALNCMIPLITLFVAWLVLHQSPTPWQLFSLIPISAGVYFINKKAKR